MKMTDVSRTGGTKDKDVGPAVQRMRMSISNKDEDDRRCRMKAHVVQLGRMADVSEPT